MTQRHEKPEDLYLQYRKIRSRITPDSAHDTVPGFHHEQTTAVTGALALPEQVYRQFQQQRQVNREESIDAILLRIRTEQSVASVGMQEPESPRYLAALLQKVKNLRNLRSPAFLLPMAVAGLLAVFVVAGIFNNSGTGRILPASLVAEADAAVEFIDNGHAQVLGFSSTAAPGKSAFNRGVLAANYLVAVQSGDEQALGNTLRYIAGIAEADSQESLVALVSGMLSGKETQSIEGVATAPGAVISMLKAVPESSGHELWFEHGQALQAVMLSAHLQQSASVSQPLNDSLAVYRALGTPLPVLPASKLVLELKSVDSESLTGSSGDGKVLTLTRDIKVLMQ